MIFQPAEPFFVRLLLLSHLLLHADESNVEAGRFRVLMLDASLKLDLALIARLEHPFAGAVVFAKIHADDLLGAARARFWSIVARFFVCLQIGVGHDC